MADVQHHVHHKAPVRTEWEKVFPADQPVAFTTVISPYIELADGVSRQNWNITPTLYGGGASATMSFVVEGSTDGSQPFAMSGTLSTPVGVTTSSFPLTITSRRFRIRMTSVTPNGAVWFNFGAAASL